VTRHVVTPTTIKLSWQEPACHGADILHYNIDMGDHVESTGGPALEHTLEGLIPDTTYRSLNFITTRRSEVLLSCHRIEHWIQIIETGMMWPFKLKFGR
jgi:hypothetical protein